MTIREFFPAVFVINLVRRPDRRAHAETTLARIGLLPSAVYWFDAYDKPVDSEGNPNGNFGCSTSHSALLHLIAHQKIPRALILEDDVWPAPDRNRKGAVVDADAIFSKAVEQLPEKWDMLYLGRHFAEMPKERVGPNLIRIGRMLTTSSYGVTLEFARRAAPYIHGVGPIDNHYWRFHEEGNSYCVDPTLFIQRPGVSDLHDKFEDYSGAMTDMNHIKALDSGTVYPPAPKG